MEVLFQPMTLAGVAAGPAMVPATTPNPATSRFDPRAIDNLLSLEEKAPGLLCSLTGQFLSGSRELITRLGGTAPVGAKEIELAAHTLKSTCALFGAQHVTELALCAEGAAHRGDLAAVRRLAAEIDVEFVRFEQELRNHAAVARALA